MQICQRDSTIKNHRLILFPICLYTVGEKRIEQNAILEVKLSKLQAVCTRHGQILPFVK